MSGPSLTFQVDHEQAALFAVTANEVSNTLTTTITGTPVSTILEGSRVRTVRLTTKNSVHESLSDLENLPMRTSGGVPFRMLQIAHIAYQKGETEIERDGLRQSVAVTARVSEIDLGTAITNIQKQLVSDVKLPSEMSVEYGGLYAEQVSTFREMAISLALAIVLVFLVLVVEFRSFHHAIAIVAGSTLALSGVFLALLITGMTLNIVSLMGMIMVVGIVAKNGILMLDALDENQKKTESLDEALVLSGRRRLRPVLMTSLAAILGMLPLALAIGAGSELLQPLAIGVIGGLSLALVLSLIVTPVVFRMLYRTTGG